MTNKENALRIIHFDHPERVVAGPPIHLLAYFGCNHESFDGGGHDMPVGSHWTDIWGTTWFKEHPGVMGFPRGFPLDEPGKLRSYCWPDPDDERYVRLIYQKAATFDTSSDQFLAGAHRDTLWEKAYMLVGMENLMEYMVTEPNFAREVFGRIMDFQLGIARHYLKLGVEIVNSGDDLGTQVGPLLGEKRVREFLVPQYRRLFSLYHRHGVLINHHSCGHIEEMLPIFMDLGVNILNPIQATANDLERVRTLTQGKLALLGGISSGLIMNGPPQLVAQEVRRRITQLGRHGGYFCAPDQGLPFPDEHRQAVAIAIDNYGRYPLDGC